MKRIFLLLWLISIPLFAEFDPAWLNNLTLSNQSGEDFYYLFFSPSDTEMWGPDVLGASSILANKQEMDYFLYYFDSYAFFDCQAVGESGRVYELFRIPVNDGKKVIIEITGEDRSDKVDLELFQDEMFHLAIENQTGNEIYYLFVSPSDSENYGIDYMGSEDTLSHDSSFKVAYMNLGRELSFDVQAVDEQEQTYSFSVTLDRDVESQYVEIFPEDMDLE